ncbi:MAG: hypothetical protein ACMUIL_12115 [bacterium]
MSSRSISRCITGVLVCLIVGFIAAVPPAYGFNGPHILGTNPCDVCHIPHNAADDLLWARTTTGPFLGVKRLCASCHGTGLYGAKDRFGIFEAQDDITYDHVMGGDASINGPSVIRQDWAPFPLRDKEGGDGFYCGSCHDPHRDPYYQDEDLGGGDYLRQEAEGLITTPEDKETAFCIQCHQGIIPGDALGHGAKQGCYDCHHPHSSPNPGPTILISALVPFTAVPNCRGFTDTGEVAAACYGCHQLGSGFDGEIGAPLAGDDLPSPKEHHPMGKGADASTSGHQPTQAGPLSAAGEIYCGTCHTVHNGTNDNYLNAVVSMDYDPADSGAFCIACHSDKTLDDLGPRGEGHHQITPYNQCLFCHSIHNSPNDPDALYQTDEDEATQFNSSASVDVFMRVAPVNLAWSDQVMDTDERDYEDACYGCHADDAIVGREFSLNEENALLLDNVRDDYFSHRFNATPSPAIKVVNTYDDRLPIVSDGKETETITDYGVEEGHIWCGSCHNVHLQIRYSADIPEEYQDRRSAYLREENYGSSLCYRCHPSYHENLGGLNHPQDIPLEGGVPPLYHSGYSGGTGGITNGLSAFDTATGTVVCQTCHSVHTARTDWDGGANQDELLTHGTLLVTPLDQGFCEDCHPLVHGGAGGDCSICHLPHNGIIPSVDPNTPFIALPNVPAINDNLEDPNSLSSAMCYACHQPQHLVGDDLWIRYGAAPVYGDIIKGSENTGHTRNHHPMGEEARLTGPSFLRAPGAAATLYLNQNREITCTSCHNGLHDGTKENNFLRWQFAATNDPRSTNPLEDNAVFCIACHSDKSASMLDGKHRVTRAESSARNVTRLTFGAYQNGILTENQVGCANCMFCHFIHDGEERVGEGVPGGIRADIDSLMRIAPKNLAWGDNPGDTDLSDYEDMCFGCHGDLLIVGNGYEDAALLKWADDVHTHPFASPPDPNNPPARIIRAGGDFPLSDGEGTTTVNDYGTSAGSIYCGTCHNAHDGRVAPYLNHEPGDMNLSPYAPFGFCEYCHDAASDQLQFVHDSHPIDKGPRYPATAEKWPELYFSGGSGAKGGITADTTETGHIICLTCHNVHAAATTWQGEVSTDPGNTGHGRLLVRDNIESTEGSDLCKDCHTF